MTRSQAAASAKSSEILPETPPAQQGKVPLAEDDAGDRFSTELLLQKSPPKAAELLATTVTQTPGDGSPQESRAAESPPVPTVSGLTVPCTPEADGAGESASASPLKVAKAANVTVVLSEEPGLEQGDDSAQVQERPDEEPPQRVQDCPGTPTGSRLSRRSVRRSLMGKTSLTRRTSLAEKYSLASKRESWVRKSATRTAGKKKAARGPSLSSSRVAGECEWLQTSLPGAVPALCVNPPPFAAEEVAFWGWLFPGCRS